VLLILGPESVLHGKLCCERNLPNSIVYDRLDGLWARARVMGSLLRCRCFLRLRACRAVEWSTLTPIQDQHQTGSTDAVAWVGQIRGHAGFISRSATAFCVPSQVRYLQSQQEQLFSIPDLPLRRARPLGCCTANPSAQHRYRRTRLRHYL